MTESIQSGELDLGSDTLEGCLQTGKWLVESGSPEVAIDWFRRASNLAGGEAAPLLSLGGAYFELRCWQAAAEAFRSAAMIDQQNIEAHFGWGSACAQMGKLSEAVVALELARDLQKREPASG